MSIDYEKLKILPLNFPKSYTYVYYLCFLGERLRKAGIELHIRYLLCLLAKAFFKGHCNVFSGKIQRRTRVLSFGVALLSFAALRRSSLFFEVLLFLVLLVGFDLQRGLVPGVQRGYDRSPELAFDVFARVLRHIAAAARDVSVLIKVFGLFLP